MKYWEIANRLSKAGWSLGWVSAIDAQGQTIWIVDAHGYGKRFIVRTEEILTAFLELEAAVQTAGKLKSKAQKTDSYTESARFGVVLSVKRRA